MKPPFFDVAAQSALCPCVVVKNSHSFTMTPGPTLISLERKRMLTTLVDRFERALGVLVVGLRAVVGMALELVVAACASKARGRAMLRRMVRGCVGESLDV
jgi:hypothetical protein